MNQADNMHLFYGYGLWLGITGCNAQHNLLICMCCCRAMQNTILCITSSLAYIHFAVAQMLCVAVRWSLGQAGLILIVLVTKVQHCAGIKLWNSYSHMVKSAYQRSIATGDFAAFKYISLLVYGCVRADLLRDSNSFSLLFFCLTYLFQFQHEKGITKSKKVASLSPFSQRKKGWMIFVLF